MSKQYQITYNDGTLRHCNRRDLDALQPHLVKTGHKQFLCTLPARSIRTLTGQVMTLTSLSANVRYPGPDVIVVTPDGQQYRECGLCPAEVLVRLHNTRVQPETV